VGFFRHSGKIKSTLNSITNYGEGSNEIGIKALDKAVDKLQKDVEKLKDKQRTFSNGNGND
jgi:ribosome-associated translation inhibitor RaiA